MSGIVSWLDPAAGRTSVGVKKIAVGVVGALAVTQCLGGAPRRAVVGGAPVSADAIAIDEETVVGKHHFGRGWPADNPDASTNAVVEIPAGTTGKFEVDDGDGRLKWKHDRDTGGLREVDYLPFPVNYGMVPRTLAADGDALDIVVLGRGIERGRVAKTRVIGVLEMEEDDGTRDDKVVAVPVDPKLENGFTRLHELDELDEYYPELRTIVWLWFSNYWGAGVTHPLGWGDAEQARQAVEDAKRAFTMHGVACRDSRGVADSRLPARLPCYAHGH